MQPVHFFKNWKIEGDNLVSKSKAPKAAENEEKFIQSLGIEYKRIKNRDGFIHFSIPRNKITPADKNDASFSENIKDNLFKHIEHQPSLFQNLNQTQADVILKDNKVVVGAWLIRKSEGKIFLSWKAVDGPKHYPLKGFEVRNFPKFEEYVKSGTASRIPLPLENQITEGSTSSGASTSTEESEEEEEYLPPIFQKTGSFSLTENDGIFHEPKSREDAEKLLNKKKGDAWLIRYSTHTNSYVLSQKIEGKFSHEVIKNVTKVLEKMLEEMGLDKMINPPT